MQKKQKRQLAASMLTIIALVVIAMAPAVFSQEDMTAVPVEGFTDLQRPQVAFNHDLHNEKAELEDCETCHHSQTDGGLIDLETSSEGETCASCHPAEPENGETPLMRAYHRQCSSCHKDSLKGPVACGECHKK